MGKVQIFGEATFEGVPEDEIIAAKLIQTASARGLKACRKTMFKNRHAWLPSHKGATACCALGADSLDPDKPAHWSLRVGIADGNDGREDDTAQIRGYDIGRVFYLAQRES